MGQPQSFGKFAVGRSAAKETFSHMHDKVKPIKTNSKVNRKDANGCAAMGHLFLGHKLLDELRILMRLSSAVKRGVYPGLSEQHEQAS